jgi:DNA-binding NtrC family response regulator
MKSKDVRQEKDMSDPDESNIIVIVDDEEIVLASLKSFLDMETEYSIKTFSSPAKALEYIKSNAIGVVVSDFLMPEMDGISFLAKVRDVQPEAPRIILTAYADKKNAIKAINEVGLYYYIEKPWNNDDLLVILRNGLERQRLIRKLEVKLSEMKETYISIIRTLV